MSAWACVWRLAHFDFYFETFLNGRNSMATTKIQYPAIKHLWNTADKLGEMTENNSRITQLFRKRDVAREKKERSPPRAIGMETNEQGNASKLLDLLWRSTSTICLATHKAICDAKFIYVIHTFHLYSLRPDTNLVCLLFPFSIWSGGNERRRRKKSTTTKCWHFDSIHQSNSDARISDDACRVMFVESNATGL